MIIKRTSYKEPYYPKHQETIKFFVWFSSFFKEDNKPAEAHFQLVDFILSKHKYKVIMSHRGISKSTLVRYLLLRWLYLGKKPNFGDFDYVLVVQDTVSMVEATFETIIALIEDTDLKNILEIKKKRLGDDPTLYIYNKEADKTFYLKGRGSGQSLRGTNIRNKRPNIVILDDIENEEKHATKESRDKLKNWFNNVVIPAINPNKYEFIFIGTPIHEDCLIMNLVQSDHWQALILPVADEFPPPENNWNKLVTSWSDRFTPEFVREIYKQYKTQGKETGFYQEYMLQVTPKDDLLFDISKIKEFTYEEFIKKIDKFTFYISIDLAVSEKQYADYTSIAVIGISPDNDWFLVDGDFGRWKPDYTIEKIFYYVNKWKPYNVVLEKVAFQLSMKTFIEKEMIKRGQYFNLNMVSRTKAKLAVIKAFQPIVELGKFWIPKDYIKRFTEELKNEMSRITNDKILATHDDLIDSISQLTLTETINIQDNIISQNDINEDYINPYLF